MSCHPLDKSTPTSIVQFLYWGAIYATQSWGSKGSTKLTTSLSKAESEQMHLQKQSRRLNNALSSSLPIPRPAACWIRLTLVSGGRLISPLQLAKSTAVSATTSPKVQRKTRGTETNVSTNDIRTINHCQDACSRTALPVSSPRLRDRGCFQIRCGLAFGVLARLFWQDWAWLCTKALLGPEIKEEQYLVFCHVVLA